MLPRPVEVAEHLSRIDLAVPASRFPTDRTVVARAGLYAWWIDDEGRETLESSLGDSLGSLIYAGQAGATSTRAAKPSTATLGSRIVNNHLRGTAYGSTFRKSISAILLEPMGLVVEKRDHLTRADNDRVSQWMREHLGVVLYPYDDRLSLKPFEEQVLRLLDPPLNLDGMARTPVRHKLSLLRQHFSRPAVTPPAAEGPGGTKEIGEVLEDSAAPDPGEVRFMVPTGGPDDWRRLLADPDLHWVVGRSARTLAHAWEGADGWPPEIEGVLASVPQLAHLRPVYGFPEFRTPLPGGRRASQTDLMVIATDGEQLATVAIEGKVDETFGEPVAQWLGDYPSPGKRERLAYLAELLAVSTDDLTDIRYQLVHRSAAAKIEAARNGSDIAMMLVHSWAPRLEGFNDFREFARLLDVSAEVGSIGFSDAVGLWLGWVPGEPKYLSY